MLYMHERNANKIPLDLAVVEALNVSYCWSGLIYINHALRALRPLTSLREAETEVLTLVPQATLLFRNQFETPVEEAFTI